MKSVLWLIIQTLEHTVLLRGVLAVPSKERTKGGQVDIVLVRAKSSEEAYLCTKFRDYVVEPVSTKHHRKYLAGFLWGNWENVKYFLKFHLCWEKMIHLANYYFHCLSLRIPQRHCSLKWQLVWMSIAAWTVKIIQIHLNHYLTITRTFIKQNIIWILTQYLNINFAHKLTFFPKRKCKSKEGKK